MADDARDNREKDTYGLADDEPQARPPSRPVSPPPRAAGEQSSEFGPPSGVNSESSSEVAPAIPDSAAIPARLPASGSGGAIKLESAAIVACPKCGAPMPGSEEVVCLRCGFDLTASQQIRTATGEVEVEPDIPEAERKPPITGPGKGGLHLPAILAGVALLIMTIAFLAGAGGLYPTVNGRHLRSTYTPPIDAEVDFTESHPGLGAALLATLRFYVMTAAFAGSALGGLYVISRMEKRQIGDINLAALRCLAIVAVCELALLFGLDYGWGLAEWLIQFIIMAGLFYAGARYFFNVNSNEAGQFGGVAMLLLALFVLVAEVIA
jgi:hypothetical protein